MSPLLSAALLLAAFPVTAQVLLTVPPESRNCPVSLSADLRSVSGVTPLRAPAGQPGQHGVSLQLSDLDHQPIQSADVTVAAEPLHRGATPAAAIASSILTTRTFHLVESDRAAGTLTATVWLENVSAIRTVTVTMITYVAAPIWHAGPSAACIATPNGIQLVGSLR